MADWGDIAQTSRVNDNSQGNGGNFNPQNKVCDFCKYVGHTRDQCFKLNRPSRGERARYRKKKRQKRTDGQKLPKKDAYLEMCKIILAPESSHEELLHYTRDSPPHVREVHQENLEEEFKVINGILGQFNFASVDTEFPGSPYSPGVKTENKLDAAYSSLKKNVDALHLIQLGVTFSDRHGNLPKIDGKFCIWQFNFCEFNPDNDDHDPKAIRLLKESGIDFKKNNEKGVKVVQFAKLMASSGLLSNNGVTWITFHGSADWAYILKALKSPEPLPDTKEIFFQLLNRYFPKNYDIKYLMRQLIKNYNGGLSGLAERLEVPRIGTAHQAGSDSVATSSVFIKIVNVGSKLFPNGIEKFCGLLYSLSEEN